MRASAVATLAVAALLFATDAAAQRGGGRLGPGARDQPEPPPVELPAGADPAIAAALPGFRPTGTNAEAMRARGLLPTGLEAVYPADADCPAMNSPFATTRRGDGSQRSPRFYRGRHSGMDIPVPEGTSILAVADGTVVALSEGESIGGLELILMHAPEDTGLGVWTWTVYKHLRELPPLRVGQRVRMGEHLAHAGVTGTTGGHYDEAGHSHLHLGAYWSPRPDYYAGRAFVPGGEGHWADALALYAGAGTLASADLAALPAADKRVAIPYRTTDGRLVPGDTRLVWPFACAVRQNHAVFDGGDDRVASAAVP